MSGISRIPPDEKYPPLTDEQQRELRALAGIVDDQPKVVELVQRTAREAMPQTFGRGAA